MPHTVLGMQGIRCKYKASGLNLAQLPRQKMKVTEKKNPRVGGTGVTEKTP